MMCRIGADASERALSNCPVIAMISRRIFLPLFPLWVKFTRSRSTKYGPQVWPPKMGLFKLTYLSLTVASGHERLTMLTMSSLHVVILGLAEEKCCSFLMWFHSDFRFRLFWVCVRVCVCVCVCQSVSRCLHICRRSGQCRHLPRASMISLFGGSLLKCTWRKNQVDFSVTAAVVVISVES